MNLDLWLCQDAPGLAVWVSGSDVGIPELGVTCRRIDRGTRSHTIAGRILRQIERLTGETP